MIRSVALLLLMSGCAGQWTRYGATQQQIDADLYQCKRQNVVLDDGSISSGFMVEDLIAQCMRARGYRTTP
jgi:hypothetical protein